MTRTDLVCVGVCKAIAVRKVELSSSWGQHFEFFFRYIFNCRSAVSLPTIIFCF